MDQLNLWLDSLPRTRCGQLSREVPVFRTCGIVGFHIALVVVLAGGLLRGCSLVVLGVLSAVCALSFYAWAYIRRAITSREELVLLEHVWIALFAAGTTLRALHEEAFLYLDVIAVGLAFFLAAGRMGCLLVGCCHGKPARMGISYGPAHVRDGFPRHLMHVRLLPVPAFEGAGLLLIGSSGLLSLPFEPAGRVLAWFLGAYSIMRFGLEGLRGDPRPHFFGLSIGRWMAMSECAAALAIVESTVRKGGLRAAPAIMTAGLMVLLASGFAWRWIRSPAQQLLRSKHVNQVRPLVLSLAEGTGHQPATAQTSLGVSIAVSAAEGTGGVYVSLSLPEWLHDVGLLCALAARSLPELDSESARAARDGRLLLVHIPEFIEPSERSSARISSVLEDMLYGRIVRQLQELPQPMQPPLRRETISAAPSAQTPLEASEALPVDPAQNLAQPTHFRLRSRTESERRA